MCRTGYDTDGSVGGGYWSCHAGVQLGNYCESDGVSTVPIVCVVLLSVQITNANAMILAQSCHTLRLATGTAVPLPQGIFTVSACGMTEFNGTYVVDTAKDGGVRNGKPCYRKNAAGSAGGKQTVNFSSGSWYMCEDHSGCWYEVSSSADLPPASGWSTGSRGSGSPPVLAYSADIPTSVPSGAEKMFMFSSVDMGEKEFDNKGVLYHIATEGGTSSWTNPHEAGRVVVKWSSKRDSDSNIQNFVSGPNRTANNGFRGSESCTQPGIPNQWMMVDLGPTRLLAVNHYALRNGHHSSSAMRNWELEGAANDAGPWNSLSRHADDSTLTESAWSVGHWPVSGAAYWRCFRIRAFGKNSNGNDRLDCGGIELYGSLRNEAASAPRSGTAFKTVWSRTHKQDEIVIDSDLVARNPAGGGKCVWSEDTLPSTGCHYWEVTMNYPGKSKGDSMGNCYMVGVTNHTRKDISGVYNESGTWGLSDYGDSDALRVNGSAKGSVPNNSSGKAYGSGDRVGVLADMDARPRTLQFFRDGQRLDGAVVAGFPEGVRIAAVPYNSNVTATLAFPVPAGLTADESARLGASVAASSGAAYLPPPAFKLDNASTRTIDGIFIRQHDGSYKKDGSSSTLTYHASRKGQPMWVFSHSDGDGLEAPAETKVYPPLGPWYVA
jgi:hypothetical protein